MYTTNSKSISNAKFGTSLNRTFLQTEHWIVLDRSEREIGALSTGDEVDVEAQDVNDEGLGRQVELGLVFVVNRGHPLDVVGLTELVELPLAVSLHDGNRRSYFAAD